MTESNDMPEQKQPPAGLTVAFVPGVTVGKWSRLWNERQPQTPLTVVPVAYDDQLAVLRDKRAHLSFVRLPVAGEDLSVVRLYSEVAVAILPEEHALAALDSLTLSDLDGVAGLAAMGDPAGLKAAVELIAAGVGAIVVPHALARLHNRKGVITREVTDAEQTQIAIVWLAEETTPDIEEFVGIVRGRSARSSRGVAGQTEIDDGREAGGKSVAAGKAGGGSGKSSGGKAKASSRGKGRPHPKGRDRNPKNSKRQGR